MADLLDYDDDDSIYSCLPTGGKIDGEALPLHVQSQLTQTIQKGKRNFKDTLCLRITLAVVLLTVAGLVLQPAGLKQRKGYPEDGRSLPLKTLRYRQVDEVVRLRRDVDEDQQLGMWIALWTGLNVFVFFKQKENFLIKFFFGYEKDEANVSRNSGEFSE